MLYWYLVISYGLAAAMCSLIGERWPLKLRVFWFVIAPLWSWALVLLMVSKAALFISDKFLDYCHILACLVAGE
jgi:hypothetical protein